MKHFKIKNTKINKLEISIFIGLIASLCFCFFNMINKANDIGNHILRLHILANSNSEEDQKLKLKVKDEILKNFNFNKNNEKDLEKIKKHVTNKLPEIEKTAKNVIIKEGFNYDVKSEIVNMNFDTREYEKFAMPAGRYDALRILIGNAKGKNWWCVMAPPMCAPAAKEDPIEKTDEILSYDQQDLIKNGAKTEIRFWLIEAFNFLKNLFC